MMTFKPDVPQTRRQPIPSGLQRFSQRDHTQSVEVLRFGRSEAVKRAYPSPNFLNYKQLSDRSISYRSNDSSRSNCAVVFGSS